MKHIRKFNESNSTKYNVDPSSEYDKDSYMGIAESIVDQVEKATKQEVTEISGITGEGDVDVSISLNNGDEVNVYYEYSPFPNKSRKTGYTIVSLKKDGETITKTDLDEDVKDTLDAGEDIYGILKVILKKLDPSISFVLPPEHYGTDGFSYDIDNESKGYTQIKAQFDSKEDLTKWLSQIYQMLEDQGVGDPFE